MSKEIKRFISDMATFLVALLLIFCFAFYVRAQKRDEYARGVQCYESGDYEAAIDVFDRLQGWVGYKKASVSDTGISPEEYRAMAFEKLHESDPSITMCPHCGQIIELEGRTCLR